MFASVMCVARIFWGNKSGYIIIHVHCMCQYYGELIHNSWPPILSLYIFLWVPKKNIFTYCVVVRHKAAFRAYFFFYFQTTEIRDIGSAGTILSLFSYN